MRTPDDDDHALPDRPRRPRGARVLRGGVRCDRDRGAARGGRSHRVRDAHDRRGASLPVRRAHEYGAWAPSSVGHATAAVALAVADVDATYVRAVTAGATADREPGDQGDERRGWLVDPFGHRWVISSPLP
ncbi:MAG: VOC family protein [Cellulomonas sp.]|nr:VOC family protein [Cellulomonas sp.]